MASSITSKEGQEFLDALKPSTRVTYASALKAFLEFYRSSKLGNTLTDFLDAVEEDLKKPRRERSRIDRNILKQFVRWLETKEKSPKTIRTYVSAIQSLASYFDIKISTKHVTMPSSQPVSKKHPWTLSEVGIFINDLRGLELKTIAATILQSGLSLGHILEITYDDIKLEYEQNISPLCFDFTRKKTDTPFMTFIGKYALAFLEKYLVKFGNRNQHGPIFSMKTRTIELHFERLAKKRLGDYKGSNPMRPHSLRAAFNSFLADAGMAQDDREFFMAHKIPEQRQVYISRSREKWREMYAKYEGALTP